MMTKACFKQICQSKLISIMLILAMLFSCLPSVAWAEDVNTSDGQNITGENVSAEETLNNDETSSNTEEIPNTEETPNTGETLDTEETPDTAEIPDTEETPNVEDNKTEQPVLEEPQEPVAYTAGDTVNVKTSATDLHIFSDSDKTQEVEITDGAFAATSGEKYFYTASSGATGEFIVKDDTTEIKFSSVNLARVTNYQINEIYDFAVTGQDGCQYTNGVVAATGQPFFVLPKYNGDSYYTLTLTPKAEYADEYLGYSNLFYVYKNQEDFTPLNLSDNGTLRTYEKSDLTKEDYIIATPKDMEIYDVWQLKFYTQRNYKKWQLTSSDDNYNYYDLAAMDRASAPNAITLYTQPGKMASFGDAGLNITTGEINGREVRYVEIAESANLLIRDTYKDSNMLTNLPLNSNIELQVGEYFDVAPLRAWQAVGSITGNDHEDPRWHYQVIGGDAVEVERTPEDVLWQFGRIKAEKPGTALVLFWYDAVQYYGDAYGATWPEFTGVAVVTVRDTAAAEPNITTNINVPEGRIIYFINSMTLPDGTYTEYENPGADYTFTPTAKSGSITGVRVHAPIMAIDGALQVNGDGAAGISDWLNDSYWTAASANDDGSYTLHLPQGKNIVEITDSTGEKAYHVISARGLDIKIANDTKPNTSITAGDRFTVFYQGLVPPLYKMGAIYNPSGNDLALKANGFEKAFELGQYISSNSVKISLQTTPEDAGTYSITDGETRVRMWSSSDSVDFHRALTRNSMQGGWGGGDNPNTDLGVMAYLPDISFEVLAADDYEETVKRNAGLLAAFKCFGSANTDFMTDGSVLVPDKGQVAVNGLPVWRNTSSILTAPLAKNPTYIQACPANDNVTVYARYWFKEDKANAVVKKINNLATLKVLPGEDFGGGTLYKAVGGEEILPANSINATDKPYAFVQILSIPQEGYPAIYDNLLLHAQANAQGKVPHTLADLTIERATGSGALGRFDGILECVDEDKFTYTDDKGQQQTVDWGTGFFASGSNYVASVPYTADKICFNGQGMVATDSVSIVKGGNTYVFGDAIPLEVGENTITVTPKDNNKRDGKTYNITVTRREAPKTITFTAPEGSKITVKESGKTVDPDTTGGLVYGLEKDKEYTWYAELPGYLTQQGTFTVSGDQTIPVTFPADAKINGNSGSYQISIAAQQAMLTANTTATISSTPADLAAKRYVNYNYGGYTVLHALVDNIGKNSFECYNGIFEPTGTEIVTDNLGANAGWVCEVNGKVVADPAQTLVQNNDVIRWYYNSDYSADMIQARFVEDTKTVNRGESVTLKLVGAKVNNNGEAEKAIAGADIYIDGVDEPVGKTDANGEVTIKSNNIANLRDYQVTAALPDTNGHNLLTYALCKITVQKPSGGGSTPASGMTVTFRLIGSTLSDGDVDLSEGVPEGYHGAEYVTWIATRSFHYDEKEITAAQLFKDALDKADITWDGEFTEQYGSIYVSGIWAPEKLGGYELSEFTNGKYSGWMYTVNGKHPDRGLDLWKLTNGDEVVFHYVNDYRYEPRDWSEGTSGNSATWDKWLTAKDVDPNASSNPGGGGTTTTEPTDKTEVTTEMKPEVTANADGEAIAKPEDKTVTETIEQAKKDNADVIVIEPEVKGEATKVGVELSKSAVEKMTKDTNADLTVKTDLGNVTVPAKGLEQLTKESGSNVTVSVEAKDGATNVEVAVGGKAVEKVTGGIGVSVPAEKASEDNVLAIVKADGTQEIVKKSIVDGKNVQAIVDGSCTVKVIENGKQFADTNNHWGKDAVTFVTAHELFNGTSETAFEPDTAMSRAMLATVLWRLEDEQTTAAAKTFSDIAGGQYYTDAVAWASDKAIVTGYEDGTFKPDTNINREELAAMLYRYAKAVGLDTTASGDLTKFTDGNKVSDFASDAMKWAVGSGLMNGKENNTLDPQGNATRAEVATTMQRLVKLLVK